MIFAIIMAWKVSYLFAYLWPLHSSDKCILFCSHPMSIIHILQLHPQMSCGAMSCQIQEGQVTQLCTVVIIDVNISAAFCVYFLLIAIFAERGSWLSLPFPPLFLEENVWDMIAQIFADPVLFLLPNLQRQSIKRKSRHWYLLHNHSLTMSLSTTGLLREGLLPPYANFPVLVSKYNLFCNFEYVRLHVCKLVVYVKFCAFNFLVL